ncbi:ABC transporter substrate-binding protein [Alkalibacillus aidingensis]|uniref:ABC transporter substrate-binding protein n=1 Tax=Alkalibacillus aidingensis TaxID=2747607 RepID=UPI0016616AE9|nr:ABC transporter substrate-binding protein [Alkalibacillus aidingensis]
MFNKQVWSKLFLTLLLALAVGLTACQGIEDEEEASNDPNDDVEQEQQENEEEEEEGEEEEESESPFPVTLTDKSGEEVTIEERPERIVSVIPSATETVFAIGAGDKVVGVSEWANYPEEVFDIETVGDMNLNIEKIVELEPDVVIADVNNGESIDALRNVDLDVVVLGAQSLEEVYKDLEIAGKATGQVQNAENVIEEMKADVTEVQEVVSDIPEEERRSVWMEVDTELYSGGQGSFMHEIMTLAGGENIIGDQEGWPQVSEEVILERNPDVIITTYGYYMEDAAEQVLERDNWQSVTAVENEEVYDLHGDIVSRPGPRLTEGLKEVASILYPDRFE